MTEAVSAPTASSESNIKFPSSQRIRRFSVEEYHRLAEAGVLAADERVELIDGIIKAMSPKGSKHAAIVSKLTNLLPQIVEGQAWIRVQDPIVLDDNTEPEPDVALVKPRDNAYATAHPRPGDVLLVIEVADTSLEDDRTVKLPRYAAAGIPEVWLIDVSHDVLAVHRRPILRPDGTAAYRSHTDYYAGDTVAVFSLPSIELPVNEIFIVA